MDRAERNGALTEQRKAQDAKRPKKSNRQVGMMPTYYPSKIDTIGIVNPNSCIGGI